MGATVTDRSTAESRTCRRARQRLCAGGSDAESRLHMESCASCADFAHRLDLARRVLGLPLSPPWAVQPDPGFSARVVALIERPAELLGWAAFRAMPAALGLALALAWLGFTSQQPPTPAPAPTPTLAQLEEPSPSTDQLIAWSAGSPEIWP
jgi:hypothetical protein